MEIKFDITLAEALQKFNVSLRSDPEAMTRFKQHPTREVKAFLTASGVAIPTPNWFHAHAIPHGGHLPREPKRAKVDRYIYFFRESGLFQYKQVPASPNGSNEFMENPKCACDCCSCVSIEM